MVATLARGVCAEELATMNNDGRRREIVNGEIREMSPSGFEHGLLSSLLCAKLRNFAGDHDLGVVCGAETGFIIGRNPDTVRAPNVAFIKKCRVPAERLTGFPDFAPDLVVEVISPSDRFSSVEEKAHSWLDAGTTTVWVIDASNRRVLEYLHAKSRHDLDENAALQGGAVLPGFALPVREIFNA